MCAMGDERARDEAHESPEGAENPGASASPEAAGDREVREPEAGSGAGLGERVGLVLFTLWAAVFCAGAIGDLLDVEWLKRATDFKRVFLR